MCAAHYHHFIPPIALAHFSHPCKSCFLLDHVTLMHNPALPKYGLYQLGRFQNMLNAPPTDQSKTNLGDITLEFQLEIRY